MCSETTDMDFSQLLKRIKFSGSTGKLDINLLNELCISFAASVPYETLDTFGGKKRILKLPLIFERVVVKNRGGLCIELNALFHWMLSELGYDVKMCMGYSPQGVDSLEEEGSHMVLLVAQNKESWLTDVGWGGNSFIFPLSMNKLSQEQSQPNGIYMISKKEDFYIIEKKKQAQILAGGTTYNVEPFDHEKTISKYRRSPEWNIMFAFRTDTKQLPNFQNACRHAQETHAFCTQNSIAVIQDRHHRVFLIGDTLVEKYYIDPSALKVVQNRKLNKDEIVEVLKNIFGILLDFELEPKSQLNWTVV